MVTHVPVRAEEGLQYSPGSVQSPSKGNRGPGWAGAMPDGGYPDFDHFKSAVKHHEELLTQAT